MHAATAKNQSITLDPQSTATNPGPEQLSADLTNVAIFANPFSGSRDNRPLIAALAAALTRRGLTPRTYWQAPDPAAAAADPDWWQACRCVVAAGGDGTAAAAVNAFPDMPLAVFPLGNENLLAKELHFTRDPDRLAGAVARGTLRRIDAPTANGRRFTLMLGAGFDADVVHRFAQWRSTGNQLKRSGHHRYIRPMLAAARNYRFPTIDLHADAAHVRGTQAFVVNAPRYSLGLTAAPDARIDDGLLHWVVFRCPGPLYLLRCAVAVRLGRHLQRRDVQHGTATDIRIHSDSPVPLQIDGDPAGHTPVHITAQPRTLKVIQTALP